MWVALSLSINTGIVIVTMAFMYLGIDFFQLGPVTGSLWVCLSLLIGCLCMAIANGELR
jgi:hypothetical protein